MQPTNQSEAAWRKGSRSAVDGECVEAAFLGGRGIGVRDSKDPLGRVLNLQSPMWRMLLTNIKTGRYDV